MADVGTEESQSAEETKELELALTTVTTGVVDCETETGGGVIEGTPSGDRDV